MIKIYFLIVFFLTLNNAAYAQIDIATEKIQFSNGEIDFVGELRLPKGATKAPAFIFIQGSGNIPYQTAYSDFLQTHLESLLQQGFALLYYNKRGVGGSTGNSRKADFYDRASDTYAAVKFLKQHPAIDTSGIGVVGHSQGGWIVQLVLSQHADVAYGISLAGPTISVREQLQEDFQSNYACKGFLENKSLRKAKRKTAVVLTIATLFPFGNLRQLKKIRRYSHQNILPKIQQPLLLLFAENDELVFPAENIYRLQAAFPVGIPLNVQHHTIPNADHSFNQIEKCYTGKRRGKPAAPEVTKIIQDWAKNSIEKE